jgi:glycosyltransferase involved in cell wall biosynthesis
MASTNPLVSVIIPTYNRLERLKIAIDSVLKQTYQPYELIIVDDGSTDGTGEAFSQSSPPIRYIWQEHRGVSRARNTGVKAATGEFIAFLDSDDIWHPNKLSVQVVFFHDHPEAMICQSQEIWVRHGIRVNPKKKHQKPSGWIFRECIPDCVVSMSAVMMRKSLFDEVGWFDEKIPMCEDHDMWLRIALRYPIYLIDDYLLTKYGGHSDQLSRSTWGIDRYRVTALKNILKDPLAASYRKQIQAEIKHKSRILAQGALKRRNFLMWVQYSWKKWI